MKAGCIKYFSIVLSIIAFLCSIATPVAIWCGSHEYIDFDSSAFYGCIITVLSILVVVLMGWQIINYLSFEDKIRKELEKFMLTTDKKINDIVDDFNKKTDHEFYVFSNKIGANLLYLKANYITSEKSPKDAVINYIEAIYCCHEAEMDTKGVIDSLSNHLVIVESSNIRFTKSEIDYLENKLLNCNIDNTIIDRIKKLEEKKQIDSGNFQKE